MDTGNKKIPHFTGSSGSGLAWARQNKSGVCGYFSLSVMSMEYVVISFLLKGNFHILVP